MRRATGVVFTLVAVGSIACGDSAAPNGGGCDQPLEFTVSSSTSPTISWNPACTVAQLYVTEPSDASTPIRWQVDASSNSIRPPVSYGSAPAGTTVSKSPDALFTKHHYVVIVSVLSSNQYLIAGSASIDP